jgi:hypothetical protein
MSPTPEPRGIATVRWPEPDPWKGWKSAARNQTIAINTATRPISSVARRRAATRGGGRRGSRGGWARRVGALGGASQSLPGRPPGTGGGPVAVKTGCGRCAG